ncbi:MAG: AmmeMemoRadiSam system protein A [Syntrophorhabdaceae bacterium]|nr:AmmeMemoRadiSam system protein A [Syntrophorhabdaceae bacterium]
MNSERAAFLDEKERQELLRLARTTLELYVREHKEPDMAAPEGKLASPGAAFVTLTNKGRLRGCIGYTEAVAPLYKVVRECVMAAATEDRRFPPVSAGELAFIDLEISVLTPMVPIRAEDVEVGRHGLMISHQQKRGLLLPQVPVDLGWDREKFLDQVCVKAGLPPGAWRRGAELKGFTAEVFGERE